MQFIRFAVCVLCLTLSLQMTQAFAAKTIEDPTCRVYLAKGKTELGSLKQYFIDKGFVPIEYDASGEFQPDEGSLIGSLEHHSNFLDYDDEAWDVFWYKRSFCQTEVGLYQIVSKKPFLQGALFERSRTNITRRLGKGWPKAVCKWEAILKKLPYCKIGKRETR